MEFLFELSLNTNKNGNKTGNQRKSIKNEKNYTDIIKDEGVQANIKI
jgi:hypothetical protein